ncbi:MAG: quinone-dependent dihydroorotate dehydrogenase [Rhizobiaceae bacterium]|nr:quinone-dependent dihydroorotate dehydrogenase [Rhizobiaceae bacterium]
MPSAGGLRLLLDRIGKSILFSFDPETAHGLSIRALKCGLPMANAPSDTRLNVQLAGLNFPNPLGMAAGYDKNAEVPDALLRLGFGFAEVGTITPLPQSGNPKPRIFRLEEDAAVINRLGFNNEGHEAAKSRLNMRRDRSGIVGVNIGANKDSVDRIADYELGVKSFASLASYLTVNISSPNTPGLRNMQSREHLSELLQRVMVVRNEQGDSKTPIFLKIAPDLEEEDLDDIAAELIDRGVDGLIVSNTTIARNGLKTRDMANESGGLSGKPLFARSTAVLARMRQRLGAKFPIMGVGGVDSAETALEKIKAGADLVQLYTGLIYGGPSLPNQIVSGLIEAVNASGISSISELRDSHLKRWLDQPLN